MIDAKDIIDVGVDGIDTLIGKFGHHIACRIDKVRIVARAAQQRVVAAAAKQRIVAEQAI